MQVRERIEGRRRLAPGPGVRATARHPGDVVRVAIGSTVVLVSILLVQRDSLTLFETNLFRLVNDLPSTLGWVLWPVMQLGGFAAVPVVALVALLVLRRRRVALDVAIAGTVAYLLARLVKDLVERPRPGGFLDDFARLADADGLGFVSGHATVAAAIVGAVVVHLPRRARRVVWLLPWVVGLARLFYGVHLPMDVVGGAALGWAVAAGVHLVRGAAHRVPTLDDAAAALRRAGLVPAAVRRVPGVARGSFPFVATIDGEEVFVKLLDPEPRDRDWLFRIARVVAVRDVRDEAAVAGPREQAYREVAMSLLARDRGVRVPRVRRVEASDGRAWVVQQHVDGVTLEALGGDVTDETLVELWRQALLLRDAGLAHRDLVGSNLLVDRDGAPWIVDLAHAETSTRRRALDNDLAELLVACALAVGVERTVATATRVVPRQLLAAAAPELQPFVLTAETREGLRGRPGLLDDLRLAVTTAVGRAPRQRRAGTVPRPARARLLLAAGAGGLVVLVGVAGPADVAASLAGVSWRWLATAGLVTALAWVGSTIVLLEAIDRRLALGRTLLAVLAQHATTALRRPCGDQRRLLDHLRAAAVPDTEATRGLVAVRASRARALLAVAVPVVVLLVVERPPLRWTATAGWLGLLAVVLLVVATRACRPRPRPAAAGGVPPAVRRVTLTTRELAALGTLLAGAAAVAALVHALGGGVALVVVVAIHLVVTALELALGPAADVAATLLVAAGLVVGGLPLATAAAAALLVAAVQVWSPIAVGRAVPRRATGLD